MCKSVWLGVDLGQQSFSAALATPQTRAADWTSMPVCEFPNDSEGIDAFVAWVHTQEVEEILGVCVEATGRLSWTWVECLNGRLAPVSIVNPARSCAFAKSLGLRSKTDRIDACVLALFGMATSPAPKAIPDSLQRQLRELAHLYRRSLRDKIAYENQLREPLASPFVQQCLRNKLGSVEQELTSIQTEMDRLLASNAQLDADFKRMQTIPGVGPKTARLLLALFGDLRTYSRNELVALAGVYPRVYQSGTSVHRKPKLAKGGGAHARAVLFMPALNAKRFCPPLRCYADRLREKGLAPMAILGAVMRKLLLLIRAVVVSETDYICDYATAVKCQTT